MEPGKTTPFCGKASRSRAAGDPRPCGRLFSFLSDIFNQKVVQRLVLICRGFTFDSSFPNPDVQKEAVEARQFLQYLKNRRIIAGTALVSNEKECRETCDYLPGSFSGESFELVAREGRELPLIVYIITRVSWELSMEGDSYTTVADLSEDFPAMSRRRTRSASPSRFSSGTASRCSSNSHTAASQTSSHLSDLQAQDAFAGRISVYTVSGCKFCRQVVAKLESLALPVVNINLDLFAERRGELQRLCGKSSVPQVFFNDRHVGGYEDLCALVRREHELS